MPQFFNKKALTSEQTLRWDGALADYARIQEENIVNSFNAMSPAQKVQYRTLMRVPDGVDLLQHMRGAGGLLGFGHTPGEKSALFARLLDGKQALPYPPPTSYSYPWYDVIEQTGPFPVNVERIPDMRRSVHAEESKLALSLNQCLWETRSINAAAEDLLALEGERCATLKAKGDDTAEDDAALLSLEMRVRDAFARGPEFIVQHTHWPAMRLCLGRTSSSCIRSHANERLMTPAGAKRIALRSALDTWNLYLNGVVGKTLSVGVHPKAALEDARVKMEARRASPGVVAERFSQYFEAINYAAIAKNYEAAREEFEADPTCRDWVELTTDGWVLEKM
jgi:hypothetical protein